MHSPTSESVLAKAHPDLFADVRCGISIGIGWVPIILDLAEAIKSHGKQVVVEQIKEKFGGLRFYYSGDDIEDFVSAAEDFCWNHCEECGGPARRNMAGEVWRTSGWVKTLCEDHAAEWDRRAR